MAERPPHLPDYRNPPIDEVVVGVQFLPITNFQDVHVGLYWQKVRSDYPRTETQPRLEGPIETAGPPKASVPTLSIPFAPTQARTWLISEADDYLIQIQNTRFLQNWRYRQAQYPHFEAILELFEDHYQKFRDLLSDEGLQEPTVQQIEVSYINWVTGLPMSRFLKPGTSAAIKINDLPQEPEDQDWGARYLLSNSADTIERLHVACQSAVRPVPNMQRGNLFQLVYHAARVEGFGTDEILRLMPKARDIIVSAFDELTTDDAHAVWGKLQ
jgi:uncharacterized protein (TIGR04255 family)